MKEAQELPPVLSVHRLGAGQYLFRVEDKQLRDLVVKIGGALEDAKTIIVATPESTKMFAVNGGKGRKMKESVAEPEPELEEVIDEGDEAETQGELPMSRMPETAEEPEPELPKTRRRKPYQSAAGQQTTCRRCNGTGQIQIVLEGGQADMAPCSICSGQGFINVYGERRH